MRSIKTLKGLLIELLIGDYFISAHIPLPRNDVFLLSIIFPD